MLINPVCNVLEWHSHYLTDKCKSLSCSRIKYRIKPVVSLTVNFTQERMCCLLSVCGNDLHFQQQTTLHKGRDATQTTQQCAACKDLMGRPFKKTSNTSVHAFYFHWLWFYTTSLANRKNFWILVPKIIASGFVFVFQGKIFWKDTLLHMHIQRLIACTGIYG